MLIILILLVISYNILSRANLRSSVDLQNAVSTYKAN
jgi:hypothetical protein